MDCLPADFFTRFGLPDTLTFGVFGAEQSGNPRLGTLAVDQVSSPLQSGGNMEGNEARFGIANSALWAAATTAASNGSVYSMHDSCTPLGRLVPLWLMQPGEVVLGGTGSLVVATKSADLCRRRFDRAVHRPQRRRPNIRCRAWRDLETGPREIRELVRGATEGRTLGTLGEPRVNVLELNLALDGK